MMRNEQEIIFEDDDLIVLNKPAGMLSIPDRMQSATSLKEILIRQYGNIFTVHRLDKDTSGVIVFAKNEEAHQSLSRQFENRETEKYYSGLVMGSLATKAGLIDVPVVEHPVKKGLMVTSPKGKSSVTEYEVQEEFGQITHINFKILTGRTHQIRVHMKYLGHPILCDEMYGNGKPVLLSSLKKRFNLSRNEEEERPILKRLGLHSRRLVFKDLTGTVRHFEAPLAKDMKALLQQLRKLKE